ncbi:MAG TPA: hypothetical protein VIC05_10320 [Solirubrobacteraceae bacterium]|jgi:hypothetical protein
MPYFVRRPRDVWELRESLTTPKGPRGRTLATFRTLTPEAVHRAQARSSKPLAAAALRAAARRVGVPVEPPRADRAAAELLAEIETGRRPRPALERALLAALRNDPPDAARAAAAWTLATPASRGEALHDLLLLVDSLPPRERKRLERFPRIESRAA